jgi:transglutaminase-like putative cysteine protease
LAIIFLALCKAAGIEGRLVKLSAINGDQTHSIAEFKLNDKWYRVDPSDKEARIFEGELTAELNWNGFKVWKKGRDVWDLGLEDVDSELEIYEKTKK